jgi:hypothetical protein
MVVHVLGQGSLFDDPDGYGQRWEARVPSWRHASDGGFNQDDYDVVALERAPALAFVTTHHYSGAFSSAVLRFGLIERSIDELVGVCVYGNSMGPHVLLAAFPKLIPSEQSLELSRLVLLDRVPANAESWFVAQTFDVLDEAGVRGVVMYSDPNERVTPAGLIMPGHLGIVYQALSLRYVGESRSRFEDHLPDRTVLPERTTSKVRGLERGARGAVRRLVQLGADDPGDLSRMPKDERVMWLEHAKHQAGVQHVKRLGKYRYLGATGTPLQRKRTMRGVDLPDLPYPKRLALAAA